MNEQVEGIGPPTSKLASGRNCEALQEKDAVELSVRRAELLSEYHEVQVIKKVLQVFHRTALIQKACFFASLNYGL